MQLGPYIENMVGSFVSVDGVLEDWADWSECSQTCGDGVVYRNRTCFGPYNGGDPCHGPLEETESCNLGVCRSKFCTLHCCFSFHRRENMDHSLDIILRLSIPNTSAILKFNHRSVQ